jgi:hypothetical protein
MAPNNQNDAVGIYKDIMAHLDLPHPTSFAMEVALTTILCLLDEGYSRKEIVESIVFDKSLPNRKVYKNKIKPDRM